VFDTKPDGTVACEDKEEVIHLAVGHFLGCIVYETIMCCETKVIWVQFIQDILKLRDAGAITNDGFL
jgi:hypothetical protein